MDRLDLGALDALCRKADRVLSLRDLNDAFRGGITGIVGAPDWTTRAIGMRHDCDDNGFASMKAMAEFEHRFDRRSTYYVLHTAPWRRNVFLPERLRYMQDDLGHEIGLHLNWVPSWEDGRASPFEVVERELDALRKLGLKITSIAGHGDEACYRTKLVNYSCFTEAQSAVRAPWRSFEEATGHEPRSIKEFGIDFLAEFVPKGEYVSDSGDSWSKPLAEVAAGFPYAGPLVVLQHPDWYAKELFA
jgi:hypothetical protein